MPCADKPRTIWPGGILVAGHDPVWLAWPKRDAHRRCCRPAGSNRRMST